MQQPPTAPRIDPLLAARMEIVALKIAVQTLLVYTAVEGNRGAAEQKTHLDGLRKLLDQAVENTEFGDAATAPAWRAGIRQSLDSMFDPILGRP